MAELLRLPEIAANTTEALVAEWLVEPGAGFVAGDPLVTVETDKAAVDVEAEAGGILLRVLVAAGTTAAVGAPIAVWGSAADNDETVAELLGELGAEVRGAAVGSDPEPAGAAPQATPVGAATDEDGSSEVEDEKARIFISPLARRLAAEAGIDLTQVQGTGPRGRIRRQDIDRHRAALADDETVGPTEVDDSTAGVSAVGVPATPGRAAVSAPARSLTEQLGAAAYTDVPHTRMRAAIARRLTESKQTAPHFYLRGSARVDGLLALRAELNAAGPADGAPVKISVNDLVVKAAARAHTLVPALNVQWQEESVRQFHRVDIAIAIATETGLVTPVLRDIGAMSISELATNSQDLAARARAKKIQPAELEGGALSVSNLGMFGTEEFAAIINPPQAAILAVGAARPEVVAVDGAPAVATVMRVTLAVDHRPVDGAAAAQWMAVFVDLLEHPARILA